MANIILRHLSGLILSNLKEFRVYVKDCLDYANSLYDIYSKINTDIDIAFFTDSNLGGTASWKKRNNVFYYKLRFNSYMINTSYEKMKTETIPHEVAHFVCYVLYPGRNIAHGSIWQDICIKLGGTGDRYHSMDTPIKKKYFVYNVNGVKTLLKESDHKKAQKSFTNVYIHDSMQRVHKHMYMDYLVMK